MAADKGCRLRPDVQSLQEFEFGGFGALSSPVPGLDMKAGGRCSFLCCTLMVTAPIPFNLAMQPQVPKLLQTPFFYPMDAPGLFSPRCFHACISPIAELCLKNKSQVRTSAACRHTVSFQSFHLFRGHSQLLKTFPPPSPYQGPEQIHSLNPSLLHPALSKIYGAGGRNFPHQQRTSPAPNERIVSLQAA